LPRRTSITLQETSCQEEHPALVCCENASRNHKAAATGTAKCTLILEECPNQLSIPYYGHRKRYFGKQFHTNAV
jgi:hypothetical protein